MKKFLITSAIVILSLSFCLFIYLNVKVGIGSNTNKLVIEQFNDIFKESSQEISDEDIIDLPKLQLNGTDYVGIISVEDFELVLPVQSICNNSFFDAVSACNYTSDVFTILGTNLKNSFNSYNSFNENDKVIFTNTIGKIFEYRIKKIKRVDEITNISQYSDADLIIIVKNYYDMNYVLFICESY